MARQSSLYGPLGYLESGIGDKVTIAFDDKNKTVIRFQSGVESEHGRNGIYIEDLIELAIGRLNMYNKELPSRENSLAITKLQEALFWLDARTADREARGVESTNEK